MDLKAHLLSCQLDGPERELGDSFLEHRVFYIVQQAVVNSNFHQVPGAESFRGSRRLTQSHRNQTDTGAAEREG